MLESASSVIHRWNMIGGLRKPLIISGYSQNGSSNVPVLCLHTPILPFQGVNVSG